MKSIAARPFNLVCTIVVLSMTSSSFGAPLNIVNPSFESPEISSAGAGIIGSTGWTFAATSPNDQWYTTEGGGLSTDDPNAGAEGPGSQFLTGNRLATNPDDPGASGDPRISILKQLIDVSADAALITSGARVSLDFYYNQWDAINDGTIGQDVGELPTNGDEIEVNINFYSDAAGTIANGTIGTGPLLITAAEVWVLQNLSGLVPAGTASLEISIFGNRERGSALNAHVDTFSGSIVALPEPGSALLMFVGIVCTAMQKRET
jgi:hypothetical protein